jgi:hypothetical protein
VLVIEPEDIEKGIYRFIGAKRGGRIGWGDQTPPDLERRFCHARESGAIFWRDATAEEASQAKQKRNGKKNTVEDLLALVPTDGPIEVNTLLTTATQNDIGENCARRLIKTLIEARRLYEHERPRNGTRPVKLVARFPPPEEAKEVAS